MSAQPKLCPDCNEPRLSEADGVLQCMDCGWSVEDTDDLCQICGAPTPCNCHEPEGLL